MNNTIKKIVVSITVLTCASLLIGPGVAQALTVEELLALIAGASSLEDLQADIAAAQAGEGEGAVTIEGVPADFTFETNLKLTSTGDDVKYLQIVLNSDSDTQLAESGVGSAGNETSYFGPLTKGAVIKFQEKYSEACLDSWGLTEGTGYVGSTTRAKLNELLGEVVPPEECTVAADCPAGYTCTAGACVKIPVGAGLTVALAADTPAAGTIVAGQSIAPLAKFVFTNGDSTEVKITSLKAKRLGVSGDTTLSKVYLYDGVYRLGDEAVVSTGVISWNNTAGVIVIPANSSKTIEFRSDILSTATGQTVGVGITAATDITSDASAVNGTFPINGNTMSIATATLADVSFALSAATTPTTNNSLEPQVDFVMFQNSVTIGTRAVNLKSITFRNIGSVDKVTDLKNFRLYIDGVQVGEAVEKSDSEGYITFDLSASPKKVETGTRVFKVVGDVIGGSTKTFQISLRKAADVNVTDSEYGANILIKVNSVAFTVVEAGVQTVSTGNLTITKRTDSPTGNVVKNGTGVTLAKYDLKAYGESIKIENLRVSVTSSDTTIGELRNGALFVDGTQVGSTQKLEETSGLGTDTDGLTYTEFNLGSSLIVVPGVPKVLEVRADIYDDDGTDQVSYGDTLKAMIPVGSSNCMRMVSGGYFASPAESTASTLTVATGVLSATIDQSYGNQTAVAPQSNYLLGKFSVSAGPSEDVNVHTIQVDFLFGDDEFASEDLTNVYVKYGTKTTSLKTAITGALKNTTSSNTWSISEVLTKLTGLTFEVYGDIASTAVVTADAEDKVTTKLLVTGTTAQSGTTVYSGAAGAATTVTGQIVTADTGGTLTVSLDSGNPLAAQVVAGSIADSLKVKLAATKEDIYVKDLTFRVGINANDVAVQALTLFVAQGSGAFAQYGSAITFNTDGANPGYVRLILDGTNRIKVAKNGSTYLLVKPTYVSSSQAAVSGRTPKITLTNIRAEGVSEVTPTITPDGSDGISTTLLANDTTSSTVIINETLTNADTTITVKTGDATTNLAVGQIIIVGTEQMLVTAINSATEIVVIRGYNGSTAATAAVDDVVYYKGALIASSANASFIAGNLVTTAIVGDVIEIENELMLITAVLSNVASGTNELITVTRDGTVAAHALSSAIDDAFEGNAMRVLNTKLTLGLAGDSPSGATSGGLGKIVFKFTASAENNALDSAENKVVLTRIDITTAENASSVNNLKVYPSEYDQNANYATTCGGLTASKWRCIMSTTGSSNEVVENTTRTYIVRGDTNYAANGNIQVSIATLGTSSLDTNSVAWTDDNPTTTYWVNQATSSVEGGIQSTVVPSGTVDATAPTITAIAVTDVGADTKLGTDDTIEITFSEVIDPTTIESTLVPGGSVLGVAAASTGGVTSASSTTITVTGICTIVATVSTANSIDYTTNLTLGDSGKVLTVEIDTGADSTGSPGALVSGANVSGTVEDINGIALGVAATAVPTGTF